MGPYKVVSTIGESYFLTILDDYSRVVWIYLIAEETEIATIFCAMIKTQFNQSIKNVRSDNGTEFLCLRQYFLGNGIAANDHCRDTTIKWKSRT